MRETRHLEQARRAMMQASMAAAERGDSKAALKAMLAEAVRNTAAMQEPQAEAERS